MISSDNLELIKAAAAGRVDLDGKALLALIADVEALRAMLRLVDRAARVAMPCPVCEHPTAEHAPDCRLAALLR